MPSALPAASQPVARSPIAPPSPTGVVQGWEVSLRSSDAALRIADLTPLTKVLVRHDPPFLDVAFGRSKRDEQGRLVIGSGPDEWTILGPPGSEVGVPGAETVVDVTHGRALMRITGQDSVGLLAKVCAINLSDRVTPNGAAFRSSVAKLVTDVVRDDLPAGERSYLLHCERSSGQYLFDSLVDAGQEFGIDVDGFGPTGIGPTVESRGGI